MLFRSSTFLLSQFEFVCLAWIAAQVATGVATVHGMMFGQSMCFSNVALIKSGMMTFGNSYLPGNSKIISVTSFGVLELCKIIGHYPPLPDALRTGKPLGAGGPLGFDVFPCVLLASGWAAACLLASADFTASRKLWGLFCSLIQLFTSVGLV